MMDAIRISQSGLDVEWRRMEVIALNLANMNTSSADGASYRPLRLISGPAESFQNALAAQSERKSPSLQGVRAYGIEDAGHGLRRAYEPNHPHADTDGFVSYPNVNHAGEMAAMVKTARAYEANLAALSAAQQMYSTALKVGRQ